MPQSADGLTKTQTNRIENVGERVAKKIIGTFGHTAEKFTVIDDVSDLVPLDTEAGAAFEVCSRGVIYTFIIAARRGS